MGPTKWKIDHQQPYQKKNEIEKNLKLRVSFLLVPLPEGRYRHQAPYADVSETLGLRVGAQIQPKMAKNDHKREKIDKTK